MIDFEWLEWASFFSVLNICGGDADEYTRAPMKVVGVPQSVHQDDMPIHAISDIPIFTVNSLVFGNNNVE